MPEVYFLDDKRKEKWKIFHRERTRIKFRFHNRRYNMANVIKERVVSVLRDLLQSAESWDNLILTDEEIWALRIAIDMLKEED